KLIKQENHHADQQNEKLHRHFQQSVHNHSHLTFLHRFPRKIALNLTLVGSEIRKREKSSTDDSAPNRISIVEIKAKIQNVHFSARRCNLHCISEINSVRKRENQNYKSNRHSAHHNRHLLFLCYIYRFCSAGNGVNYHQNAENDIQVN